MIPMSLLHFADQVACPRLLLVSLLWFGPVAGQTELYGTPASNFWSMGLLDTEQKAAKPIPAPIHQNCPESSLTTDCSQQTNPSPSEKPDIQNPADSRGAIDPAKIRGIVDLQPYARVQKINLISSEFTDGIAELINLNPKINSWFVLKLRKPGSQQTHTYHIENIYPDSQKLKLVDNYYHGLVLLNERGSKVCNLWGSEKSQIGTARNKKQPFVYLCDERMYLRTAIEGYRTTKEWVVEFLRDNIWGGETITEIVKETIYKDAYLIESEVSSLKTHEQFLDRSLPPSADLSAEFVDRAIDLGELGIPVSTTNKQLLIGDWYPTKSQEGAFISVMRPEAVDRNILSSYKKYVKDLDKVEAQATTYLIAFDLDQFDINFSIGTEHPRVGWSARAKESVREPNLSGPDGFASIAPLTGTGLIPPHLKNSVVATFTGGFKRSHGAFKWGRLSRTNRGTHYGFIENGVILSSMQPELATAIIFNDGQLTLKTWQKEDEILLPQIKHARQNGVPIIDSGNVLEPSVPGRYVSNWTLGNWSGSQDREFRTLRAGMCLIEAYGRRYLTYGYFSSATPTAMARVFQAYNCKYAMHLDMNALEHTYLSIYATSNEAVSTPEPLVEGMRVLDQRFKGNVPRFIGYPDNRDFFYLTKKDKP